MSFAFTWPQVLARTKTVTRRRATTWRGLGAGDRLLAVSKAMGFRPGERPELGPVIEVVSVRVEPLEACTDAEAVLEGFPELGAAGFVAMLGKRTGVRPTDEVRRIEFRYVGGEGGPMEEGEPHGR